MGRKKQRHVVRKGERHGGGDNSAATVRKITVIIVFLLVLLFGIGQFFARPVNPDANQPSATAATRVVRYTPPLPASSTTVIEGSCWTGSIAAPYRMDAWRCAVGNGIEDPCFSISGSTSTVLCGANPANSAATSSFVLTLQKPLPKPNPPAVPPLNWAWLVKLTDGTVCSPFTGTLPLADGQAAEYGCAPRYRGEDRMIFGDLNASSSVWTAEVGTISSSTSTFPPPIIASSVIPVATVWQ